MLLKGAYCVGEHFVDPQLYASKCTDNFINKCYDISYTI